MDVEETWQRLRSARSGVLGTVDTQRGTHLVPVVYTPIEESRLLIAVDAKPKRSRLLRRLANIERDPRVTLLVDRYSEDWSDLWWVRADGNATVLPAVPPDIEQRHRDRFPQVEGHELGPWIDVAVEAVSGWSAR